MVKENSLIVKQNNLVEANYKLTLQEQKLILLLISKIQKDDDNLKNYIFTVDELATFLGTEINYKQIRKAVKLLQGRVITIESVLEKGKVITDLNWTRRATYYTKEGIIEIGLNPDLKPFLLGLKKNFTKYNLKDVVQLESVYAIRIYELLKQYENIGNRRFELEELKEILGIKNKYKLYGHFKDKVLKTAKREINAKTDLEMDFEEIKRSRKVIAIKFLITKKNIAAKRTKETEEETRIIDNFLQQNPHLNIKNPGAYRKKLLRVLREKGYLDINEFEERLQREKQEISQQQEELLKEANIDLKGLFKKI